MSSNAFDPRKLNKGPNVKFSSKSGDEKLLEMKHCFHLFIFVTDNIFVVGDLDNECFEDRNWTLFLFFFLVTCTMHGTGQAHNQCLLIGRWENKY